MTDDLNALPPGASIAGYQIIRTLGAGGFGITYEAESPFTGKRVAIKEFFPRGIASRGEGTRLVYAPKDEEIVEWALRRFETSTLDQCRLKHPNIVDVVHYVKDNGTGYMIMEYVEGETLEHWLRARGDEPTPEELQPLLAPVLSALEYLHGANMIHRDIAPDNIMVRPDGTPMIIDFGAVKLIQHETQLRSEAGRSFAVMKQFYSPAEQIQEDGEIDHRADIYSFGAVLYRALAGQPPASAEARMQKIALAKTDPYVPLGDYVPELAPEFSDAVDRALAFDARDRQPHVDELRYELGWSEDADATAATLPRALRREADPAPRRSRLPWILPLIGIAAVAIGVAYSNGLISLPTFGGNVAQQETPAPKLDDAKEVPEMQVKTEPDGSAQQQPQATQGIYPKRYRGEVGIYRMAETNPAEPLIGCDIGRTSAFSIEIDGSAMHISHGGNTYVTEIAADGTFNFESGLFSRKMQYSGKITPEALAGDYVATSARGSCYGKLSARPVAG
ncbi:MAG TPA: serine/threonine-protein kinase [Xanthobacteraceae bacterium]|nr:serine/threonine-protein kinase [Xanthobacteraceae bacterium]